MPPPAPRGNPLWCGFTSRKGSAGARSVGAWTSPAAAGGLLDGLDLFANGPHPFFFCCHQVTHRIIDNVPVAQLLPPSRVGSALQQQHSQHGPELRLQLAAAVTMTLGMHLFDFPVFSLLMVCSEGDPSSPQARAGAAARVRWSGSLWSSHAPEVPKPCGTGAPPGVCCV